jgi:hypothetical protein
MAQADNFIVNDNSDITSDNGLLTLREAITQANESPGPDTISFSELYRKLSGEIITLTEGELIVSDDLHIDASNLAEAPIIDADQQSRLVHFTAADGDLELTKLTLRNGKVTSNSSVGGGGILFTSTGALTLTNSTLSANSVTSHNRDARGGGISTISGAIFLANSTLRGNSARGEYDAFGGGIYAQSGDITLTNSTLSGNSVKGGRGDDSYAGGGGGGTYSGAITVVNSTVSGNSVNSGSYGRGGGIYSEDGAITLTNSTVSGNFIDTNGDEAYGGGIYADRGDVTLTNSTVTGNSVRGHGGSDGGGIYVDHGKLVLTGSIIAGNESDDSDPDISPSNDLEVSHCLIGDSTGARLDEAKVNLNNITDVDPLLGPLSNNGGPTQTHALQIGSPAIDQGNATGTDQRGAARVDNPDVPNTEGGNGSDIGAYERTIPLIVSDPSDVTDGDFSEGNLSLREAITLTNDSPGPDTIGFADHLSGEVIILTQGELTINDDLHIDASNLVQAPVIDADQKSRVMHFTVAEGDLQLTKLTLRNGEVSSDDDVFGGGILSASTGDVILTNSALSGNSARSSGRHDDAFGGGICAASGDIILIDSTLSGNTASSLGYGAHAFGGGAFTRSGAITLTNSTVSGNSAIGDYEDGEAYGGGICSITGSITVTNSSLSKNHVSAYDSYGGGICSNSGQISLTDSIVNGNYAKGDEAADGVGIFTESGAITLTNSTLSGNAGRGSFPVGGGICSDGKVILINSTLSGNSISGATAHGGGISGGAITLINSTLSGNSATGRGSTRDVCGGGICTGGEVTLINSTLTDNSAIGGLAHGGGISVLYGNLILTNSIVAENSCDGSAPDIEGPNGLTNTLEVSHSLIGDSSGAKLDEATVNLNNITDVDPLLAPLANNGGPTQTHALGIGSPAIDQGNATDADQRGIARIDDPNIPNAGGGNGSDIGAFEIGIPLIVSDPSDVTDDDFSEGNLTLREAIALANDAEGPDFIGFTEDLSGEVITLTQGELAISEGLSIDALRLAQAPVIDADQKSRVMHFTAAEGDLRLTKLTLRNGKVASGRNFFGGGILFASGGTLALADSILSGNSVDSGGYFAGGGGISTLSGTVNLTNSTLSENSAIGEDAEGGGIHTNTGAITLTNSTLNRNSVSGEDCDGKGGGIHTDAGAIILKKSTLNENSASGRETADGGGIHTFFGTMTLINSTLSGNSVSAHGHESSEAEGGGIFARAGAITLTNSTLSGNYSSSPSGEAGGGGIFTGSGSLTLTNSTLSGNSASGRACAGGGINIISGTLTLSSSTLSGNSASGSEFADGGGIRTVSGTLILNESIIAGNLSNWSAPDLRAPNVPANLLELSHCLIGNSSGARLDEAKVNFNNRIDVDPLLAPLADNGGDTQTMLPFPGSPVIDGVALGWMVAHAPSYDQRGLGRYWWRDIGAVEYQYQGDLNFVFDTDTDRDGNSFGIEQALGTDPYVSDPGNARNLTRPTFNTEGQPMLGFGIADAAARGTFWILERTTDLIAFQEIYRFDGTTHTLFEEFPTEFETTETGVIVTDQNPPIDGAFYRFRSTLSEPE